MPDTPKWDDTEDMGADVPKFEDTSPVAFEDTEPADEPAKAAAPEKFESMDDQEDLLDSGVRVSKDKIQEMADRFKVPRETLEKMAVRYGATYPDSTQGERAYSRLYKGADNVLLNIPSWIAKKTEDAQTEQAIDALKDEIQRSKSGRQKAVDFAENIVSPVGLGRKALQETGKGLSKMAPESMKRLSAFLSKYGGSAAQGGAMAGTAGVTNSKSGDELRDGLTNAGVGVVAGPLIQAGVEKTAKLGSRFLGRGDDVAEPYLRNPNKYNDPELTFENVKSKIQAPIDDLRGNVEAGRMGVEAGKKSVDDLRLNLTEQYAEEGGRAKDALEQARAKYSALEQMLRQADRDGRTEAREQLSSAMQQARAEFADALSSRKKPELPADLPGRVKDAVKGQREAVSRGSSESFDILAESGQKVDIEPIKAQIMRGLEPETIMGQKVPVQMTPERKVLARYAKMLKGVEGPQDPGEAKKLVQALQRDLQEVYAANTGAYRTKGQRAIQDVEATVQDALKNQLDVSDKFRSKMTEVAADTSLAKDASRTFGKRDILPALYSMRGASKAQQLGVLQQLAKKHDPEIITALEKFWSDSAEFSSPAAKRDLWKQVTAGLQDPTGAPVDLAGLTKKIKAPSTVQPQLDASDEARLLSEAEDGLLPYRREYLKPAIENQIKESPQAAAAAKAASDLELAQSRMAPVQKFVNKDPEDLIRANMITNPRKPNIEEKDALSYLSGISGEDLADPVEALRVKTAFAGGGPQGSRLVNAGRTAGRAIGGSLGAPKAGEVAGALAGGTIDYTTGKAAKLMLDAAIKSRDPAVRGVALLVQPIMSRLTASPAGEKYSRLMDQQSKKGPEAMLAAHQALMKADPEYAKLHAEDTAE